MAFDDGIVVPLGKEWAMVEGFRICIKGAEVVAALSRRIAELEQLISKHRVDLASPQVDRSPANAMVSRQSIELTIKRQQAEIDTLALFRDRIVTTEEYLLDGEDLRQAHLVPTPPSGR